MNVEDVKSEAHFAKGIEKMCCPLSVVNMLLKLKDFWIYHFPYILNTSYTFTLTCIK